MSKSNVLETGLLQLIFNAVALAGLAENQVVAPVTHLTVALHTADPGETGDQTTNEVSYFGYARQSILRTAGGWTVTGSSVSPVAPINFPTSLGGPSETVTHFSIGTGISNELLYSGTVTPNLTITASVAPQLTAASTITED